MSTMTGALRRSMVTAASSKRGGASKGGGTVKTKFSASGGALAQSSGGGLMLNKPFIVKIQLPAQRAEATPPLGPVLGQRGIKAADFCAEFNARTVGIKPDVKVPTYISIYPDRSFNFSVCMPTATTLLLRAAGLEKGAARPGERNEPIAVMSLKVIYEIAKIKSKDNPLITIEGWCKRIVGSARTMGIKVIP